MNEESLSVSWPKISAMINRADDYLTNYEDDNTYEDIWEDGYLTDYEDEDEDDDTFDIWRD